MINDTGKTIMDRGGAYSFTIITTADFEFYSKRKEKFGRMF